MKKTAYVFVDDFGHPKDKILPIIPEIFDFEKWHVCVMDDIRHICCMPTAPDLIASFKVGNSGIIDDEPSWYESSAFTYQWMRWVRENGCGLLIVHAGLCFIPRDHPVITEGVKGYFLGHPDPCPIRVEPVEGCSHPIMEGVVPFEIGKDEHFQIEWLAEDESDVLAYSYSDAGGKQPSVWAREVGNGRIAVILPGHPFPEEEGLKNKNMLTMMRNAVEWCGKPE